MLSKINKISFFNYLFLLCFFSIQLFAITAQAKEDAWSRYFNRRAKSLNGSASSSAKQVPNVSYSRNKDNLKAQGKTKSDAFFKKYPDKDAQMGFLKKQDKNFKPPTKQEARRMLKNGTANEGDKSEVITSKKSQKRVMPRASSEKLPTASDKGGVDYLDFSGKKSSDSTNDANK